MKFNTFGLINTINLPIVSLPIVSLPMVSLPMVSLPIVSLFIVSLPIVSLPIVSLPIVGLSMVSLPMVSLPIVSLPIVSLPIVGLSMVSLPMVSLLIVSLSLVSLPIVSLPMVSLPIVSLLIVSLPMVSLPIVSLLIVSLPMVSLPIVSLPTFSLPMVSLSMVSLPLVSLPIVSLPMVSLPIVSLTLVSLPTFSLPMVSLPIVSLPLVNPPLVSAYVSLPLVNPPLVSLPMVSLPMKQKNRTELEEALKRYTIYDKEELEFAKYGFGGEEGGGGADYQSIWLLQLYSTSLYCKTDWTGYFFMKDVLQVEHIPKPNSSECKRRNKIWELFRSEVVYLVDHILILKNFDTKISPAYQTYCMNYDSGAVEYLKKNEEHVDFRTFLELREKECGKSRLGIKDFLAAPIQRITKYPLLLREIRDNTPDNNAKNHLMIVIENVSTAISNLEKKVKWLAKFERLKELDEMIVWPQSDPIEERMQSLTVGIYLLNAGVEFPVHTMNYAARRRPKYTCSVSLKQHITNYYVNSYIRTVLNENTQLPNQMLFGSNKRNLASEGPLQMMESNKFVDIYILLFEDLLLLTRKDSKKREKKLSTAGMTTTPRQSDSIIPRSSDCNLNVHKEPIPLDRISIIDMDYDQGVDLGVKNIFALVQFSRYGQPTGVTILAAQTQLIKNQWKQIIESTKEKCIQSHKDSHDKKARKEVH
ncbi:putative pleckstrin-likey domain-containing family G member 5 isoform X2 [Apostichopus japonicus]|uniref:Putative pleckstrin-likey domain-containing family G member 5 isoform X2 n=1 Tax=Stichopus japonicus TaxID=307972 RepID=A0A2G8LFT0_STIJA|nr:putative pleckstrin-likey domain-containing family G member 5 isoform X2 [Apostichopus japonicus]